MADRPILIIADSRGRGLEDYVNRTFVHLDAIVIWKGGLTLYNTYNFAREAILH